jgi:hypothetical protein
MIAKQIDEINVHKTTIIQKDEEITLKDDKIDQLMAQINKTTAAIMAQNDKIIGQNTDLRQTVGAINAKNDELLGRVEDLGDEVVDLKENVGDLREALEEKAIISTMLPKNTGKHARFMVVLKRYGASAEIHMISKQSAAMRQERNFMVKCDHTILIEPFYIANGIDYRNNVNESLNDEWKTLQDGNKVYRSPRYFDIRFGVTKINWYSNNILSMERIIEICHEVKSETQAVPDV